VCPLLAGEGVIQTFQEPPEAAASPMLSFDVSLPAG
jgi:hypothetical protein